MSHDFRSILAIHLTSIYLLRIYLQLYLVARDADARLMDRRDDDAETSSTAVMSMRDVEVSMYMYVRRHTSRNSRALTHIDQSFLTTEEHRADSCRGIQQIGDVGGSLPQKCG